MSAYFAAAVTPADATDLPNGVAQGLYIGVTGDVSIYPPNSATAVVFKSAVAGSTLNVQVKRVLATATTATNLVALYQ